MSVSTKASVKTRESKTGNSSSQANKNNVPAFINSPIDQIYFLQRTVGNREVEGLLKSGVIQAKLAVGQSVAKPVFQPQTAARPTAPVIQAKLKIGEPNDKLEEEADSVAELAGNDGGSILPSAVAQSPSAVGSLQRLYGNRRSSRCAMAQAAGLLLRWRCVPARAEYCSASARAAAPPECRVNARSAERRSDWLYKPGSRLTSRGYLRTGSGPDCRSGDGRAGTSRR